MNILILNAGSSSIKFQLLQMPSEKVVCSGMAERIGQNDAVLSFKSQHSELTETGTIASHQEGLERIVELLLDSDKGVIKHVEEIDAVGHRVVHGGKLFTNTTLITNEVKGKIAEFATLAPLHNPHNLEGIHIAERLFPKAPQIAVFDTAFHQTIPEKAKKYALPNKLYEEEGIQVYGFHGTSHKYVSEKAIAHLQLATSKILSIHLGNGCSMTAIVNGKSMDHSLGFAPSNGLIMGSRSGDIDHAIIFHLVNKLGYELSDVERMINKESGMLGLTGYADLRDIQREAANGDKDCVLALEMNAYRIKKYIGAYAAAMNGVDAIIFTAGIGENSNLLRSKVCSDMEFLELAIDQEKNEIRSNSLREIQSQESKIRILVIPTNEELEIAKQAFQIAH
ncbi:acetate/propionate family kinase [Nonlabens marinus]|uniref:Acetate kinase n=1 Tax=Nonlabens marinus S1-08 TaxID=1454201 RepID=W8W0A4_9FLAO|nr:acetate kinase [Nonlabens marinus]BAO55981.1 acetate kinase [Nonlabens marinus S1-08]